MMSKRSAVVVSAHLDDGVFSCGDLLAARPGSVVITVFAGGPATGHALQPTSWDAACGFRPGDDVVVDNASTDETASMVRSSFPRAQLISLGKNLGAAGRNIGAAAIAHPYIAFCDDDCWWNPGSLRRGADTLDRYPRLALVSGRVLVGPDGREDATCRTMERSPLPAVRGLPGSPVIGFLAGATMIRRSAFLQAGGFNPRLFIGCEEQLLAIDLASMGWHMAYMKGIVVHHYPSTQRELAARREIQARNRLWVVWLRRPLSRALADTLVQARAATRDGGLRRALVASVMGLPWVLRQRHGIPAHVERTLRMVEAAQRPTAVVGKLPGSIRSS